VFEGDIKLSVLGLSHLEVNFCQNLRTNGTGGSRAMGSSTRGLVHVPHCRVCDGISLHRNTYQACRRPLARRVQNLDEGGWFRPFPPAT
jgi:hypothetical protein